MKKISFFVLINIVICFYANAGSPTVTRTNFTGNIVPQYELGNMPGSGSRLPVVFEATITGLTAGATYEYFVEACISSDIGTTNAGGGNTLCVNTTGAA